ncbi:MAG: hypothetical protein ACTSV2_06195 [Candidatus Thorarchaeota archaeon]
MAVAITDDVDIEANIPKTHPQLPIKNFTFTIFLTPVIAWSLAVLGYIPFDPILSGINGFLFSLVYVGYRVYYWRRSKRKFDDWQREASDGS